MPKPLVALVGRPNVGKSTLFNRIVGERIAIVEDVAGTTRDRLYASADWAGHEFTVIDTGGLEVTPGSDLARRVREQAELAIHEADVVVFMVDGRQGITAEDEEIAAQLRQSQKPVLLAANKADNEARRLDAVEFYRLGLGEVVPISALHGTATGDLLDEVVGRLPKAPSEEELQGIGVAIVGRPNVGKSSILNAILGRERSIVSSLPGTTRDVIDTPVEHRGERLVLLDTAGIRRRGRVEPGIEKYSVIRALRAIDRSDLALLVLDAVEGITAQDTHLAGYVVDGHKGVGIVVNKWDLVTPKTDRTMAEFSAQVRDEFRFMPYAPILFTSAKTGRGIDQVLDLALSIWEHRNVRVPTAGLNDLVQEAVAAHAPAAVRGRRLKVYYVTQAGVNPPTFVFFVNDPGLLHFTYERYLENRLRQSLDFEGTPLRFIFRPHAEKKPA
jgi:GTP-binding protein